MARKPRFNLAGVPQHVIQRGNNREPCFYGEAKPKGSDSIENHSRSGSFESGPFGSALNSLNARTS